MRDPAKHKSNPITPTDSLITTSFKLKYGCKLTRLVYILSRLINPQLNLAVPIFICSFMFFQLSTLHPLIQETKWCCRRAGLKFDKNVKTHSSSELLLCLVLLLPWLFLCGVCFLACCCFATCWLLPVWCFWFLLAVDCRIKTKKTVTRRNRGSVCLMLVHWVWILALCSLSSTNSQLRLPLHFDWKSQML